MPRKKIDEEEKKARQYKRQSAWNAENLKRYNFAIPAKGNAELIGFLDSKPNRSAYIISLIRKDMSESEK